MKKLLVTLMLAGGLHTANAGSDNALMDWDLSNAFGSMLFKVNTVGTQQTIGTYARIGFIIDATQMFYIAKGGSLSGADLANLSPSPYLLGQEFIGYEYIVDYNQFLDFGFSLELGTFVLGDGTNLATGGTTEGTAYVIVNISQSVKLQLGYGYRYSFLNAAKLTAMGLTSADVDKTYLSFALDIGAF
ncbi:MAG: hypothetical protein OEW60_03130 [Thiovulaceae bacterium]|nr:hypothetical protein [Sulfurimonadaceae bacterium]